MVQRWDEAIGLDDVGGESAHFDAGSPCVDNDHARAYVFEIEESRLFGADLERAVVEAGLSIPAYQERMDLVGAGLLLARHFKHEREVFILRWA